jgi:hypothetical protein
VNAKVEHNDDGSVKSNLIINYLPQSMSQDEVRILFAQLGDVDNCKLVRDKATGSLRFSLNLFHFILTRLFLFANLLFHALAIANVYFLFVNTFIQVKVSVMVSLIIFAQKMQPKLLPL